MKIIGHIHTDFKDKFGVPRQSGLAGNLKGVIEFEPEYRQPEAFQGLEEFDYIWALFIFHKAARDNFSATVKPPRLGGNVRKGVFATRSPFRPNNIGMSSLKLEKVEYDNERGPLIYVSGVDMIDNTPIVDIKPYLPYADSHEGARAGFTESVHDYRLTVSDPDKYLDIFDDEKRTALMQVLEEDPRPGYQNDPFKIYKMRYGEYDIHFRVDGRNLTIENVIFL